MKSEVDNSGISESNSRKYSMPREQGVKPSCIVVTYSVSPSLGEAVLTLQKNGTSVHYIIDTDGKQYQYHNDLNDKAFFAGKSHWKGQESVNGFGIGIMFINDARNVAEKYIDPINTIEGFKEQFKDFTQPQRDQAKFLLQDISKRYPDIDMKHDLVSLGEVAERHIAPGPKFFWKELAEIGFGMFRQSTEQEIKNVLIKKDQKNDLVTGVQSQLKKHGYNIIKSGICDESTQTWFYKFNTRYVPDQYPPNEWSEGSQNSLELLLGEVSEQPLDMV